MVFEPPLRLWVRWVPRAHLLAPHLGVALVHCFFEYPPFDTFIPRHFGSDARSPDDRKFGISFSRDCEQDTREEGGEVGFIVFR